MDSLPLLTSPELWARVNSIDLTRITQKLALRRGWNADTANEAADQYRRFLYLIALYHDDCRFTPSEDIDAVWHEHIMATKQYHHDCENLFGKYLHHFPMLPTDDPKTFGVGEGAFDKVQALYLKEFGEYIYEVRFMFWSRMREAFFAAWKWPQVIIKNGVVNYESVIKIFAFNRQT